jgi:hypothetical protein
MTQEGGFNVDIQRLFRRNSAKGTKIIIEEACLYEDWLLILRRLDVFMKYGYYLRSMKRREGVFSPKAQKRYVCKVSCIVKN